MASELPSIEWKEFHPQPVIGVDEVGRGCLAGPVFAAAVILKKDIAYPDSKTISAQKREALAKEIKQNSRVAVAKASVEEVDRLNIFHASLLAMRRAVLKLSIPKAHVLIDGAFVISGLPSTFRQTAIVKGDARAAPIAAASIVAKVSRDHWISSQDKYYPEYGFASHKGYATLRHREALKKHGLCPHHRRSFLTKFIKKPLTKGQQAEEIALQFFKKQNWQLVQRNQKIAGVEIDLIFYNKTKAWLLVEVKSDNKWRQDVPMSRIQRERLLKAWSYFCQQHNEPVQMQLAIVGDKLTKKQGNIVKTFSLESYLNFVNK